MLNISRQRITSGAGAIFLVLLVISNLLPTHPPRADAAGDAIVEYFLLHRTRFLIALYLQGLSIFPLLVFAVGLTFVLAPGGQKRLLTNLTVASAAVTGAVALGIAPFWAVLAYRTTQFERFDVVKALFDLGNLGYNLIGFPFGVFICSASVLILRSGRLSTWLGWSGLLVASTQFLSAAAVADHGVFAPGGASFIFAFILFAVWIAAICVVLWLRRETVEKLTN